MVLSSHIMRQIGQYTFSTKRKTFKFLAEQRLDSIAEAIQVITHSHIAAYYNASCLVQWSSVRNP